MTFDPAFEPDFDGVRSGKLSIRGKQASLGACAGAVIDSEAFIDADAKQSCAATYCGLGGTCAVTNSGAACACEPTFVAQRFLDLDGKSSVTCVPATPPVDLRANGEQLPDACAGVSCGAGTCIDRNGVAVCDCNDGAAAAPGATVPRCEPIVFATTTPGGEDYSEPLRALDVCAPPPPSCDAGGWLHKIGSSRPGVDCGGAQPAQHLTRPGPKPTCDGWFGCGCSSPGAPPASMIVVFGVIGIMVLRRRPRGRGR
jgi:MYXO-CTERM domain-containing protein